MWDVASCCAVGGREGVLVDAIGALGLGRRCTHDKRDFDLDGSGLGGFAGFSCLVFCARQLGELLCCVS